VQARFLQHRFDVPRRQGTREEIALAAFAAQLDKLALLRFGLDALGNHALADRVAHGDDGAHHLLALAAARKPVFSIGTFALAVTMVTAIIGASVDTGVLPPMVHATIAYGAIVLNLAAAKIEIAALAAAGRIVDEVNRQIQS